MNHSDSATATDDGFPPVEVGITMSRDRDRVTQDGQ